MGRQGIQRAQRPAHLARRGGGRGLLLALLLLGAGGSTEAARAAAAEALPRPAARGEEAPRSWRLAGLSETLPGLFLDAVNDLIQGKIEPARIVYEAPSTLRLTRTRILDPQGGIVAEVGEAEVDVKVTALLRGDIVIERLRLVKPALTLERRGETFNLLEAFAPTRTPSANERGAEKPAPDITVRIDALSLEEGVFRYRDGDALHIDINALRGTARVEVDLSKSSVRVDARELSSASGRVSLPALALPLADIRLARASLEGPQIVLENLRGVAAGATLRAEGKIGWEGAGSFALRGQVAAPAGTWPERLAPLPFQTPQVNAEIRLDGPLATPEIRVVGDLGPGEAYAFAWRGAHAELRIDGDAVDFTRVRAQVPGGHIDVTGRYGYADASLALRVEVEDVESRALLSPAKLDTPLAGRWRGHALLQGRVSEPLQLGIEGTLRAHDFSGFDFSLPGPSDVRARLQVNERSVDLTQIELVHAEARAALRGTLDLLGERIDVQTDAEVRQLHQKLAVLPEELQLAMAAFRGAIRGPYDDVHVVGEVSAREGVAWKLPLATLRGDVDVSSALVRVQGLEARVAEDTATGALSLRLEGAARSLGGQLRAESLALASLPWLEESDVALEGRAALEVNLGGTLDEPRVAFVARVPDLRVQEERLGALMARGVVTASQLRVDDLNLSGGIAELHLGSSLRYGFAQEQLGGEISFRLPDASAVLALARSGIKGALQGSAVLGGQLDAPEVMLLAQGYGLGVSEVLLGDGPLWLRMLPLPGPGLVVQASSALRSPEGALSLRASYAPREERVHAELRLEDVVLEPWLARIPALAPLMGSAGGRVVIEGPLDDIRGEMSLRVPNLYTRLGDVADATGQSARWLASGEDMGPPPIKPLGPLHLEASFGKGRLRGRVCGLSPRGEETPAPGVEGCAARALDLSLDGTYRQAEPAVDVHVRARVQEAALQVWSRDLRDARGEVSAALAMDVDLSWSGERDETRFGGELLLEEASLLFPDTPRMVLERPGRMRFSQADFEFLEPMAFEMGGSGVRLAGRGRPDDLDLLVEGRIGLALAKLYVDDISAATGTMSTKLVLKGNATAPRLTGFVRPDPGASIASRSLRDRVDLVGGALTIEPVGIEGRHRVRADALEMRLSGGRAWIDGDVHLMPGGVDGGRGWSVSQWMLQARGSGLTLGRARTFVETSFQLSLQSNERFARGGSAARPPDPAAPSGPAPAGAAHTSVLSPAPMVATVAGQVEINDGLIREDFEMKNFVLTSKPEAPGEPIHKVVARVLDADEVRMDVDVAVQDFRVRADVVSFPLEARLVGNLHIGETLALPDLSGAIEVVDGFVSFPRTRMEVSEARIEFPKGRPGLEPRIYLSARGELPPELPRCETEIPVVMTLEGERVSQMQMDLRADDSGQSHTRIQLLGAVVLGRPLPECGEEGPAADSSAALRALLNGVASGVTKELEAFVAKELGSELKVGLVVEDGRVGTDVRWRFSKRLHFEGGAGIGTRTPSPTDATNPARNIGPNGKVRLLLLDHFPVTGDLFLEGGFASAENSLLDANTAAELKLKYRVFGR